MKAPTLPISQDKVPKVWPQQALGRRHSETAEPSKPAIPDPLETRPFPTPLATLNRPGLVGQSGSRAVEQSALTMTKVTLQKANWSRR
jgi:hypothetical protein